jgi:hypothetical protein
MRVKRETADLIVAVSIAVGIYAGCIIGYVLGMYL